MTCSRSMGSLWIVAILHCCAPSLTAEDFPLEEYETSVKRYLASLENLAVDFSRVDPTLDGLGIFREEYSLISMPDHFRVKVATTFSDKGKKDTSSSGYVLLRPDGYFDIKQKGESEYLLKGMDPTRSSPLLADATTALNVLLQPICDVTVPLIRMLRGDVKDTHVVTVTGFERHPVNTGTAYTLRLAKVINKGQADSVYEFNEHWLLNRATTLTRKGTRITVEFTYTQLDDRPLPERVALTHVKSTGQRTESLTEFRNWRKYQATPQEFGLAQFGLPEPAGAASMYQGKSHWYLWFLALGVVCLGVGAYLRRRSKIDNTPPGTVTSGASLP